ncbi:Uncharacterised protein [Yersinia enterocolitica]|nr:Uncharacterised protein [Yersinia enterocolitica]
MRPSMLNASMALPQNSTTWPVPPALPVLPIMANTISLAVIPAPTSPLTSIFMVLARPCFRVWVANTCSTSEVPIPKAKEPNAPCVAVWESPQTMVIPGNVMPCSGPITWTMPWNGWFKSYKETPNSAQFLINSCI